MKVKYILYVLIGIAILAGVASIIFKNEAQAPSTGQNVNAVRFLCNEGKTIDAVFYPDADTHVDLKLSDGRSLSLPHALSASGARYANANESIVFWNKGDTAFMTENGTTTIEGCVVEQQEGGE